MIADVTDSTRVITEFLMVTKCEVSQDKKGRPYLKLTLSDRTGNIEARYWDNGDAVPAGSCHKVQAETSEYNGETQLKVIRWRPAVDDDGIPLTHYLRASERDREAMLAGVRGLEYEDPQVAAVIGYLLDTYDHELLDAPAAKGNHQPYLGGLLEHITNLLVLAESVVVAYDGKLDRDVMVAACVVHDLGKVLELQSTPVIGYTRRGTLVGHIGLGLQMWADACDGSVMCQPESTRLSHIEHIIASHHGIKEWGALQEPMTREAAVFHQLDMIDSRMGFFDENVKSSASADEFAFIKGQRFWLGGAV